MSVTKKIRCPRCKVKFRPSISSSDNQIRCTTCHHVFVVPPPPVSTGWFFKRTAFIVAGLVLAASIVSFVGVKIYSSFQQGDSWGNTVELAEKPTFQSKIPDKPSMGFDEECREAATDEIFDAITVTWPTPAESSIVARNRIQILKNLKQKASEFKHRLRQGLPVGGIWVGPQIIEAMLTWRNRLTPKTRDQYAQRCIRLGLEIQTGKVNRYNYITGQALDLYAAAYNFAYSDEVRLEAFKLFEIEANRRYSEALADHYKRSAELERELREFRERERIELLEKERARYSRNLARALRRRVWIPPQKMQLPGRYDFTAIYGQVGKPRRIKMPDWGVPVAPDYVASQ